MTTPAPEGPGPKPGDIPGRPIVTMPPDDPPAGPETNPEQDPDLVPETGPDEE